MSVKFRVVWAFLNRPLRIPDVHTLLHRGDHFLHICYSGLVAVEAHGFYAYAAGGLFTIAVIALFIREPL